MTVRVEDADGNPLAGREVVLKQGEQKVYATLDDDGSFTFDDSGFNRGEGVVLKVANSNDEKIEIPFVLEPDEDEYILQGKIEKKSPFFFLGILLLLTATAVGAYFLAPHFFDLVGDAGKALS